MSQSNVVEPLHTLHGSVIKRSKYGVGKQIGNKLYIHRTYLLEIIPKVASNCVVHQTLQFIDQVNKLSMFNFNCVRIDLKTVCVALVESSDFDTAREPTVGRMYVIKQDGSTHLTRPYNQIWHHKWLFVDDSYTGFDVTESWEWSRKWLSMLPEKADGSSLVNWQTQLSRYNLQ